MFLSQVECSQTLAVRVWDTVSEDQTLRGEYKVISGRMYVVFFFTPLPFVI